MGALGKLKKINNKGKEEEVKIVKVDMDSVLRDEKWDIATRENQEKIAKMEAEKQKEQEELSEFEQMVSSIEDDQEYHMEDRKYVVDGYGIISDLSDSILGNCEELIKVLEKARDREQWLYILDNAKDSAFDITFIDYLFEHDYSIKEYKVSTTVKDSCVSSQSSIFYRFLKQVLASDDSEDLVELLSAVTFIDDRIIEIVVNNKDRNRIIKNNYLFKYDEDKLLFKALLDYESKQDKKDFSFLNSLALTNINQENIEHLLEEGYVISEESPRIILDNNEIIRKLFLNDCDKDVINLLLTKVNNKKGFCWKLYNLNNKTLLSREVMKTFGMKDFINIIKYVEFSGINIDLDRIVLDGNIEIIKRLYKAINVKRVFNVELFIELVNLYETNYDLVMSLMELEDIDEYLDQIVILLSLDDKSHINSLAELSDIGEHIYKAQVKDIEKNKDILALKDYICYDLIMEHYLSTHKMLIELLSSDKLISLKNSILDKSKKKEVDKYINLSLFLENLIECDNIAVLKNLALTVSECVYKTMIWNKEITNIKKEVLGLYTYELNEKLTDFNKYMTNKTFNVSGVKIPLVNIDSEEFNILIEKVPYYNNVKNLSNCKMNEFSSDIYRTLNGISDEFASFVINNGEVVLLYNKIADGSLWMMANREMGINYEESKYGIDVNTQMNAMPFRKCVVNTKPLINNSVNEYIVSKELVNPCGVLIFGDPSEEQIKVANYFDVPLVNVESITNNVFIDDNGVSVINYVNIKDEEEIEEEISYDNINDQFLELFGSLLEIKGEPKKLLIAEEVEDDYQVVVKKKIQRVIPIFRESEYPDGKIDINEIRSEKIKSDIYKKLFSDASINYELKKVIVDDEIVLSAVRDIVDYDGKDVLEYNITDYLKKMAISYLLGDPYDADTYQIKQDYISNSVQLFDDIDLVMEYEDEMEEIAEAYKEDLITIDFIELIDFIGKIDSKEDEDYLNIFRFFIKNNSKISTNKMIEALLNKKHTLIQKMGEVIEYFTKAKESIDE